jgi:hypothetical protein
MHQAADYAVNLALHRDHTIPYPIPAEGLLDERFVDQDNMPLNAERIFRILCDEQQQQDSQESNDIQTGDSDGNDSDSSPDNSDSDDSSPDTGSTGNSKNQDTDSESDDTDSGSDNAGDRPETGQAGAANETRPNVAATGDLLPAPDDMEESEAQMETAKAETLAGALPGYLREMISETINAGSEENYRDRLRHLVSKAFDKSDYSRRKPNMRYADFGIFPTLRNPAIRRCAIATDTSGSMSIDTLNRCAGEIKDILDDWMPLETVSLQFDGRVQCEETLVCGQQPTNVEFVGRGGTRFKPVFDRFESDPPDVLIMLTDMLNFDTVTDPDYPVIWCNMSPYVKGNNQDFGEYVDLS